MALRQALLRIGTRAAAQARDAMAARAQASSCVRARALLTLGGVIISICELCPDPSLASEEVPVDAAVIEALVQAATSKNIQKTTVLILLAENLPKEQIGVLLELLDATGYVTFDKLEDILRTALLLDLQRI